MVVALEAEACEELEVFEELEVLEELSVEGLESERVVFSMGRVPPLPPKIVLATAPAAAEAAALSDFTADNATPTNINNEEN